MNSPTNRPPRDRDTEGRARSARPRDGLGRPLPRGAEGVARQPEGVVRTPADTIEEAQQLLRAGRPFHAHEVFEDAWKSRPADEERLWRGLAQLAVGLTHGARGNVTGGARLLRRGAGALHDWRAETLHDGRPGTLQDRPADDVRSQQSRDHASGTSDTAAGRTEQTAGQTEHGAFGLDLPGLRTWAEELATLLETGAEAPDPATHAPRLRGEQPGA